MTTTLQLPFFLGINFAKYNNQYYTIFDLWNN